MLWLILATHSDSIGVMPFDFKNITSKVWAHCGSVEDVLRDLIDMTKRGEMVVFVYNDACYMGLAGFGEVINSDKRIAPLVPEFDFERTIYLNDSQLRIDSLYTSLVLIQQNPAIKEIWPKDIKIKNDSILIEINMLAKELGTSTESLIILDDVSEGSQANLFKDLSCMQPQQKNQRSPQKSRDIPYLRSGLNFTHGSKTTQVKQVYFTLYNVKFGHDPVEWGAKQNGQIRNWLRNIAFDNAMIVVKAYFDSSNPYYYSKKYPIGLMIDQSNQIYTDSINKSAAITAAAAPEMAKAMSKKAMNELVFAQAMQNDNWGSTAIGTNETNLIADKNNVENNQ